MTRSIPVLKESQPQAHSRILGLGVYRSPNIVTNDDIAGPIDSSDEWIRQRTGIATRRRADADVTSADMAEHAAREALKNAGIEASDIDAVLVSTVTHWYQTPSAAALIADRLGATPAAAYDISAACAGYCYGIAQGDALVRSGSARYVLVIGSEKLSDFVDPTDRSISFLLGDGAGAVVIGPSDFPGISRSVWGSDGSHWNTIRQTRPWNTASEEASDNEWPTLRQEGPTVFRWAVQQMTKIAQKALDEAGITADQLDAFIPHQANERIIDEMAKKLKLPESVAVARDIVETGNTSAASIPLATDQLLKDHPELHGGVALQIGFGAGLVYGAQVVVLP